MRSRLSACSPASVATTFTMLVGFGMRGPELTMCSSNATFKRPPESRAQASSSALIQRRAAPMPRVSEAGSESELRVPKEASLRIRASILTGEISATMAAMRGFGSPGAAYDCPHVKSTRVTAMPVFMNRSMVTRAMFVHIGRIS